MSPILIFNGSFSSGKTTGAEEFYKMMLNHTTIPKENRVTDGFHLVHQIKDVAHGPDGAGLSNSHYHPWMNEPTEKHNHLVNPHFPFTVCSQPPLDNMIRGFLQELWQKRNNPGLIIAELGTGVAGDLQVVDKSGVDLSTRRFVEIVNEQNYWKELKKQIMVVTVDADFEIRKKRNLERSVEANGINRSWLLADEAIKITQYPDPESWLKWIDHENIFSINNNAFHKDGGDGLREQLVAVKKWLTQRWPLIEGNPPRSKER